MPNGNGIGLRNLEQALARYVEVGVESGMATDGANTTLEDTSKDWEINRWADGDIHIIKGGIEYVRSISANTANVVTFAALPVGVNVAAGDVYSIRRIAVPQDVYKPQEAYDSSIGEALTVDLDTGLYGGRTQAEVWVRSSAAAVFTVYGSRNGADWREVNTITIGAAGGEEHLGYMNAYRHIRVSTPAANDNQIEIASSR